MLSIYTSGYRLNSGLFDWEEALDNFSAFADEVVVATTLACPVSDKMLLEYSKTNPKIIVKVTDYRFDDLAFDGRLKNAALQSCNHEFCILLDLDERISVKHKPHFVFWANQLANSEYKGILIPVVDIFYSPKHAKSIGMKWYLHKRDGVYRGVVNFARLPNGKINHTKSDTCEAILEDGSLIPSLVAMPNKYYTDEEKCKWIVRTGSPVIFHLGYLNKQKRLKQNEFWKPVWSNRAGFEVKDIILEEEKLDSIPYFEHNLGYWND